MGTEVIKREVLTDTGWKEITEEESKRLGGKITDIKVVDVDEESETMTVHVYQESRVPVN